VTDLIRKLLGEKAATEEAAMRLAAVCWPDQLPAALLEVERRERLFAEAQRTGPRSLPCSPTQAALDSVYQDVVRGYSFPHEPPLPT